MWESIEISVENRTHRGRYRIEGRRIVLQWRGGQTLQWCGHVRPEVVALTTLRRLVSRKAVAA